MIIGFEGFPGARFCFVADQSLCAIYQRADKKYPFPVWPVSRGFLPVKIQRYLTGKCPEILCSILCRCEKID